MKKIIITESQLKKLRETIVRTKAIGRPSRFDEEEFAIPINDSYEEISVTIIAEYEKVDMGIGSYEFWGETGYDSRIGYEFIAFTPKEGTYNPDFLPIINNWINNNNEFIEDEFTKKLEKE